MRQASKNYAIAYAHLATPAVYTNVQEHGVALTLRYLCDPVQRRVTTSLVWEDILAVLEDRLILIWPTQRNGFSILASSLTSVKGHTKWDQLRNGGAVF